MICEKILGTVDTLDLRGKKLEYVDIEWHEAFKKIHKKKTDGVREIGIRMDDSVLTEGLKEGDVIWMEDDLAIVVHTPPCPVILISVREDHPQAAAKVCYEIGNRHAPLFFGSAPLSFVTPDNEPMYQMLSKIHGVALERKVMPLDFGKKISASIHNHHH